MQFYTWFLRSASVGKLFSVEFSTVKFLATNMKQYDQLSLNKFSAWINKTVGKDYAIQLHLFVRLLQSLTFFGKLCLGIKRKERRTSWLRTTLADY